MSSKQALSTASGGLGDELRGVVADLEQSEQQRLTEQVRRKAALKKKQEDEERARIARYQREALEKCDQVFEDCCAAARTAVTFTDRSVEKHVFRDEYISYQTVEHSSMSRAQSAFEEHALIYKAAAQALVRRLAKVGLSAEWSKGEESVPHQGECTTFYSHHPTFLITMRWPAWRFFATGSLARELEELVQDAERRQVAELKRLEARERAVAPTRGREEYETCIYMARSAAKEKKRTVTWELGAMKDENKNEPIFRQKHGCWRPYTPTLDEVLRLLKADGIDAAATNNDEKNPGRSYTITMRW